MSKRPAPLPHGFYDRPALDVAPALLGCVLHVGERTARIVETEAYIGEHDLACHASKGRTARTEVLFGPPGRAYVYLIYGMHHCLNAVTEAEGTAAAVLIRAAEPLSPELAPLNGPGRLCRSLEITLAQNRVDLCRRESGLWISAPEAEVGKIVASPRIGVDYSGEWAKRPYRFSVKGNEHVSKPWPWAKTRRKPSVT
jgi:DNA-3-methyladenine glycosylase